MCTVTYAPFGEGYILTSNRDEYHLRETNPPRLRENQLVYPKDQLAGGTWIAAGKNGTAACLLNGAFKKHPHQPPYSKSRGVLLLETLVAEAPFSFIATYDLTGIEPFTLLLIAPNSLVEWRWDGEKRYITEKDPRTTHLWASATLYEQDILQQRKQWFENWLQREETNPERLFAFHRTKHSNDTANAMVMKRPSGVQTVSITQIVYHAAPYLRYVDLKRPEHSRIVPI